MNTKKFSILMFGLLIGLFASSFGSCKKDSAGPVNIESEANLKAFGQKMAVAVATKDYATIANAFQKAGSLRLSPYSRVDVLTDKVFTPAQFMALGQSTQEHVWGTQDGSGEPIVGNFKDFYYPRYLYSVDFLANPLVTVNNDRPTGNAINNVLEVYPGAHTVEYFYEGTEYYSYMDWRSLKFVVKAIDGELVLLAIVNGRWTI